MKSPFECNDYCHFLKDLIFNNEDRAFTQAELARVMGCQASYLSQVLKRRAELTEDHAVKLCLYLDLPEAETEYLLLQLRLTKAGTPALRDYLEGQKQRLKDSHAEVDARLTAHKSRVLNEMSSYYCSSWIPATLHVATSCKDYQSVAALAERFRLDAAVVEEHLIKLERYGLVKNKASRWHFAGGSLHFSKNSMMDLAFQMSRRMHLIAALPARKKDDIHFSSLLTLDAKTCKSLRNEWIEHITAAQKKAQSAPAEEVYALCLDFYRS